MRIKDPELLKRLHFDWRECVLCLETYKLSLHHIHKHPRDDVEANLVMLCGDGVTGCHGLIEARDPMTSHELGQYILASRPDTITYLIEKTGGAIQFAEWIRLQYGLYAQV